MDERVNERPNLYLVGVRLNATRPGPELYTLLLLHEGSIPGDDRPLTRDGAILWFSKPELAARALLLGDEPFREAQPFLDEVAIVYDIAHAISLIAHADQDDGAVIVNCLNILLDAVSATGFPLLSAHRTVLSALADHTTFSKEIGEFLNDPSHDRAAVLDAITWAVGAITSNSEMLSFDEEASGFS